MITLFLQLKIRSLKKKFKRGKRFKAFCELGTILLFFDCARWDEAVQVVESLEEEGKRVVAFCFVHRKPKLMRSHPAVIQLTRKELSVFSIPRKKYTDTITQLNADALIDLRMKPSLVLDFLFYSVTTDYRVGFERSTSSDYDLLLALDKEHDFSFFSGHLLFYLKRIRTS
jgi:hypothetical protein